MTIDVRYPSGRRFTVTGTWHGPQRMLPEPNILGTEADAIVVIDDAGCALVLDPRGTYTDRDTGQTLYRGVQ
jgi:hypothetical protein